MLGRVSCAKPACAQAPLVGLASGALLAVAVDSSRSPPAAARRRPRRHADTFLTAWAERDYAAMRQQVLDPPPNFKAVNAAGARGARRQRSPQFTAGRIRQSGSHATAARPPSSSRSAASGSGTRATTVKLIDHKGHWLVAWTPATINPALDAGDRLAVVRDWPTRAPILGAGGAPLTTEHKLVTVGVVGSRIKDAHAVTADLLAAGATKTEIDQALAQAKAHPDLFRARLPGLEGPF